MLNELDYTEFEDPYEYSDLYDMMPFGDAERFERNQLDLDAEAGEFEWDFDSDSDFEDDQC